MKLEHFVEIYISIHQQLGVLKCCYLTTSDFKQNFVQLYNMVAYGSALHSLDKKKCSLSRNYMDSSWRWYFDELSSCSC